MDPVKPSSHHQALNNRYPPQVPTPLPPPVRERSGYSTASSVTYLPPIRQIRPEISSRTHPQSSSMLPGPSSRPVMSPTVGHAHGLASEYSDNEDDPPSPPKKKRRRQALSCTECKRRKIKCDRAQPCGPCTRRGEQSKCQWHIIEPMEKYVTRTEYEDLKARFDSLEAVVSRLAPGIMPALSHSRTSITAPGPAESTHNVGNVSVHPGPAHYDPVASVREGSALSRSYSPGPAPRSPLAYHGHLAYGHALPRVATTEPSSPPTTSSSRLTAQTRAAGSRRSSLSLAAITAPFVPGAATAVHQPKNLQAQTLLTPGPRLRQPSAH